MTTDGRETSRRPRGACALTRGGALTAHDKRVLLAFIQSLKTQQSGTEETTAAATESAPADSVAGDAATTGEPRSAAPRLAPGPAVSAADEQTTPRSAGLAERLLHPGEVARDHLL